MKKSIIAIGLIAILAISLFFLTGCGGEEAKGLVGTWKYNGSSTLAYTFNADGTGNYAGNTFTYVDNGSTVVITYTNATSSNTYNYTIEGKTLKITDDFGSIVEYSK